MRTEKTALECPQCSESLKKNLEGTLNNGQHQLDVYFCQDCEQSFVLHEGRIKFIPFRDDMTPIKHECLVCAKIENFDQDVCFVFNGSARYSVLCLDCAVEYFRNWGRNEKNFDVENVTTQNVQEIAQLHELICANKLFQNPNYIEFLKSDPAFKNLKDNNGNEEESPHKGEEAGA